MECLRFYNEKYVNKVVRKMKLPLKLKSRGYYTSGFEIIEEYV